ncbi:MAG: bifunctional riboflavin kinase/FAD synthetase [Austwickia sp.]|nr:bifunctional riboflavin kinase/FAD synthetase [Austwickia sp.]
MQRWSALEEIPDHYGPSVVTLGNFDGVHKGHRAVLGTLVERGTALGLPSVAVTFDPHPLAVLRPDAAPERITTSAQRGELLQDAGLSALLVMDFTPELAAWSPEHFVREVFVDRLAATVVVVGEDTRFGTRNSGDVHTLRELGEALNFEVVVVTDLGDDERWSSTQIRRMLGAGDVEHAAQVLGRPHRVCGTVVHGDHRGRDLGYPTANLSQDSEGMVPADGVYAGWLIRLDLPVHAPDRLLPAAISIGTNPTFDGTQRRVEAYVLDRTDLELYGEHVGMEFVRRLRPTLKFEAIEELLDQMREDVQQCRETLSTIVPRSADAAGESAGDSAGDSVGDSAEDSAEDTEAR